MDTLEKQLEELQAKHDMATRMYDRAVRQRNKAQFQRDELRAENKRLREERDNLRAQKDRLRAALCKIAFTSIFPSKSRFSLVADIGAIKGIAITALNPKKKSGRRAT